MATRRSYLTPDTIAYRAEVFTIAEEISDALGVDATAAEVAETYRAKTGDRSSRAYPRPIARLLNDPARFSPFVDDVAVERAVRRFEPDVIANLSDLEWQTVTDRLAQMGDPWDEKKSQVPLLVEAKRFGVHPDRAEAEDTKTERRLAFERLPAEVRARLQYAVMAHRADARKEVAA